MKKETPDCGRRTFLKDLGRLAAGSALLGGTAHLFFKKKVKRVPCGADHAACRECSLAPDCGLRRKDG